MSSLRDDAKKVQEALAALKRHDAETDAMHYSGPGVYSAGDWQERTVERRRLSVTLEDRACILARLVLAVSP